MSTDGATSTVQPSNKRAFLLNVIWNWAGVACNILIGLVLSPIIIRKLGMERYGVWVLLFSTMDYMRILDIGFRSAVVNACARSRARDDLDGVNRIVMTASLYFAAAGLLCCLVFILLRDVGISAFNVPPALRDEAHTLVVVVAITLTLRFVFAPFTAILEAFQRFDIRNHAYIAGLAFRSAAWFAVLFSGYGLVEMAWIMLITQLGEMTIMIAGIRRVMPQFRISTSLVDFSLMGGLFRYGRYSAIMSTANLFSIQAPTLILGHFRGPAEVGIFVLPFRLLMYTSEAFAKVSEVTSSVTAEFDEARKTSHLWKLAIQTNKHCLTAFVPLAIFLLLYGSPLLQTWVKVPGVAATSGPLIPVFLICYLIAIAGQWNSGAVLIGQGKHAWYSFGVVAEVVLSVTCLVLLVPFYGALGAAWVVSLTITLGRGVFLALLMCHLNNFPFWPYIRSIYGPPLLAALPVLGAAFVLRNVLPGRNWPELILAGGLIALVYFSIAFFYVIDPEFRDRILNRFHRRRPAAVAGS